MTEREMTEREWEKFFELMGKIVSGGGSWQEKAEHVKDMAHVNGAETQLEEFAAWFPD
jgi:hypothetical protein